MPPSVRTQPELTIPQRKLLIALHNFKKSHGESPTRKELAKACGCVEGNVQKMLWHLHELGFIRVGEARARSVHINYARAAPELFLASLRDWLRDPEKSEPPCSAKRLSSMFAHWRASEGIPA